MVTDIVCAFELVLVCREFKDDAGQVPLNACDRGAVRDDTGKVRKVVQSRYLLILEDNVMLIMAAGEMPWLAGLSHVSKETSWAYQSVALSSWLIQEEVPRICAIRLDRELSDLALNVNETVDGLATAEWSIWVQCCLAVPST